MRSVVSFLISGIIAGLVTWNHLSIKDNPKVLAQTSLSSPIPTSVSDTQTPSPSQSPSPTTMPSPTPLVLVQRESKRKTPSPIPTTTPSPKPTTTPTIVSLSTPAPTNSPTPTPTQTPTAFIQAPLFLEPLFSEYAAKYAVDPNLLKKIAYCESHFNSGVVAGPYAGMFQFTSSLWNNARTKMNVDPNPDLRFGARESIETAAYVIKSWGTGAWANCAK